MALFHWPRPVGPCGDLWQPVCFRCPGCHHCTCGSWGMSLVYPTWIESQKEIWCVLSAFCASCVGNFQVNILKCRNIRFWSTDSTICSQAAWHPDNSCGRMRRTQLSEHLPPCCWWRVKTALGMACQRVIKLAIAISAQAAFDTA